ncbi:hypothetical protein Sjap_007414 [Stephania japonica]|uniref:Uncharacterized protein n=1 Tax=Stephania japonica TaxID=461633 RepID=A0AAP0JNG2_9MAGN
MASQAHLAKVAKEGFAMVDEWRKKTNAQQYGHARHQPAPTRKEIDCKQAAQIYGGILYVDYTRKKTYCKL